MNEFQPDISLLPTGFVDLLPEQAEKESWAIDQLMDCFGGFGYRKVKPPLMEFEDSMLAPGPGASLAPETFRVMDPSSHRMLGLRADITPQIARIVCSRMAVEQDGAAPLRLMYANDVLRTRAGQLRASRQFCQVGCELVGGDDAYTGVELCLVALLGLRALGVADVTLDISMPRLIDMILQPLDLDVEAEGAIRTALQKRERETLVQLGGDVADVLVHLLDATGDLSKALDTIDSAIIPAAARADFEGLKMLSQDLPEACAVFGAADINLTFDPFETKGFEYHNGLAFTLFSPHIRGELGRGGQYDLRFGAQGDTAKARGFTLYMDTILSAFEPRVESKFLAVGPDVSWAELKALQEAGWVTFRCDLGAPLPEHCTHRLNGSTVEEL